MTLGSLLWPKAICVLCWWWHYCKKGAGLGALLTLLLPVLSPVQDLQMLLAAWNPICMETSTTATDRLNSKIAVGMSVGAHSL